MSGFAPLAHQHLSPHGAASSPGPSLVFPSPSPVSPPPAPVFAPAAPTPAVTGDPFALSQSGSFLLRVGINLANNPHNQTILRRMVRPLSDGSMPSAFHIENFARTLPTGRPLLQIPSQLRSLQHGFQISSLGGSTHVRVYVHSGSVVVTGRAPNVQFVEDWTIEAPARRRRRN
eukprot:TRINITY_DN22530_c0_g3_i1.p1 TRINITY_DN22530_c0_g3~~TRINITY_DN22530_c0_g3_i1.p1  ORF type:complete len:198 (+),score=6.11 TRINITY_DN22530_c0_g3_i1:73-594(+)